MTFYDTVIMHSAVQVSYSGGSRHKSAAKVLHHICAASVPHVFYMILQCCTTIVRLHMLSFLIGRSRSGTSFSNWHSINSAGDRLIKVYIFGKLILYTLQICMF